MKAMKADFFSKATKSRSFDFLLGCSLFKHRSMRIWRDRTPLTHKETTTQEQKQQKSK